MKVIANGLSACGDASAGEVFCCDLRHFTRLGAVGILTKILMSNPVLEVLDVPLIPQLPLYTAGFAVEIPLEALCPSSTTSS